MSASMTTGIIMIIAGAAILIVGEILLALWKRHLKQ